MAIVFGLVLLEAVLQVVAWAVWTSHRPGEPDSAAAERVLCLGDSFTYGVGASTPDHAYPAQAERLVREAGGPPVVFVNRGWPGQSSRDVLERLPGELRRYRPRAVYVLVGTNDAWLHPARLDLDEDAADRTGFPLRWRTRRLVLLLLDRLGDGAGADAEPFVGTWHTTGLEVVFGPTGELRLGPERFRWSVDEGQLRLHMPGGWVLPIDWRLEDGSLWVECTAWSQPFRLEPGPLAGSTSLLAAWQRFDAGDFAGAAEAFRVSLAGSGDPGAPASPEAPNATSAHEGLARSLARLGREGEAAEELDWLRGRYAETRDAGAGESLAAALVAAGDPAEAVRVSREVLEEHEGSERALSLLVEHGPPSETPALLAELAERAAPGSHWRATLLARLARAELASDPVAAVRALLAVVRERGSDDVVLEELRTSGFTLPPKTWSRALAGLTPEETALADRLAERFVDDGGLGGSVLAHHLRQIAERCRLAGARLVLLDYPGGPFARPGLDERLRDLASELEVDFLDTEARFAAVHATEDFFVSDGHCSDRGYEEIARLVSEHYLATR